MDVRFSGVRINSYRFDPAKVPMDDRTDFAATLRNAMAGCLGGSWKDAEVPASFKSIVEDAADRYDIRFTELKRIPNTPQGWGQALLTGLTSWVPGLQKTNSTNGPQTQIMAMEIHGKQNGDFDMITVALDGHDEIV
jgi:hypothetical protein